MTTRIYIIEKIDYLPNIKGLMTEENPLKPRYSFWNRCFPCQMLSHNPDINSEYMMIEVKLPRWKRKWQKLMFKIFNFKIGKYHVKTGRLDNSILPYNYND
jgi:hypothetical protein